MDLKGLQTYAKELSEEKGWTEETLESRLNYLKSEVVEAIEEVRTIENAKFQEEKDLATTKLGFELFDILWNVAELANRFDIDLTKATEDKIRINRMRDFSTAPSKYSIAESNDAEKHSVVEN